MDKQELRDTLLRLHSALLNLEGLDDDDRKALKHLIVDIQDLIKHGEAHRTEQHDRLDERLRDGIERFEASHPDLTALMGQAIDMLARIGI